MGKLPWQRQDHAIQTAHKMELLPCMRMESTVVRQWAWISLSLRLYTEGTRIAMPAKLGKDGLNTYRAAMLAPSTRAAAKGSEEATQFVGSHTNDHPLSCEEGERSSE